MVNFDELKDKAQSLAAEHSDSIKSGITKAGDFVGSKIGDEKVDPIEEKLHGLVDKVSGKPDEPPAAPEPPIAQP